MLRAVREQQTELGIYLFFCDPKSKLLLLAKLCFITLKALLVGR
jgi:hypothetical protein